MNQDFLKQLLDSVANGRLTVQKAQQELVHLAVEDIDFAHIDHHRSLRKGFPEVIFGEGKSALQIISIMEKMAVQEQPSAKEQWLGLRKTKRTNFSLGYLVHFIALILQITRKNANKKLYSR